MGTFYRYIRSAKPLMLSGPTDVTATLASIAPVPYCNFIILNAFWNDIAFGFDYGPTATIGGVAMTPLFDNGVFPPFLNAWYLFDPPRGSNSATVTWPNAVTLGGNISCHLQALGFTGVSAIEGNVNAAATSSAPSVTTTPHDANSVAINSLIIDISGGDVSASVGLGETQRFQSANAPYLYRGAISTQLMGGDGVMNWILLASVPWYSAACGLKFLGGQRDVVGGGCGLIPHDR